LLNDPRLSRRAHTLIADPNNDVFVSPAIYWEIAIKLSTGKYALNQPYHPFIEQQIIANRFQILPIELRHTAALVNLPFHHHDPFDRLLVAQALVEQIPLVSSDARLDAYGINRLW
jgi:PIN domain nuclease of toxin-antitoxin system